MLETQTIFPVGPAGSSPLTAAARSRLLSFAAAIQAHVGSQPSACWYPFRSRYTHGPDFLQLDIGGSLRTLSLVMLHADKTHLPTIIELADKLPTGSLTLPVFDLTDAFYLSLFLFDNLTLRPALDPEQVIVPRSIRHGFGVFSCR